jgi:UDP-galactopyranose mutase
VDCDVLVVGAGFAGLVVAERLVTRGRRSVVVVDRKEHLGGHSHDRRTERGNWIHTYGPHYFRTDSDRVVRYLGRFTEWRPCRYRVRCWADGRYWSFPVNLNTYEELVGREATEEEFRAWLESVRVPVDAPRDSEEMALNLVGRELYERFYLGYTLKQWQRHPRDLPPSVCARIPVRTNRNDDYLTASFQAIPARGYTAMFERLVESCGSGLEVRLGERFRPGEISARHLVYTGALDAYFDRCHGTLPYRSLEFDYREIDSDELRSREPVSGRTSSTTREASS